MSARTSIAVIVFSLCLISSARAESVVELELELGGDNNGLRCNAPAIAFTSGSTHDGSLISYGDPLTWAVRIRAYGTQASGDSAGYECRGVASFAFDLELHEGTEDGPLVDAIFYSSTNDGTDGCPNTAAAFA